ncbi:MAG: DUF5667 domain-containing protein, partial [Chloroflexota bacterium]
MKHTFESDPLDSQVIEMLDGLRDTPGRSAQAAERGRVKFLAEMDQLFPAQAASDQAQQHTSIIYFWYSFKERFTMKSLAYRTALTTLGIVLALALFLTGGASMAARAAQGALPGDALYPFKTGLERAQLSLSGSEADQAGLYLQFAQRRMEEIQALLQIGRGEDAAGLLADMNTYLEQAAAAAAALAQSSPDQAAALQAQIQQMQQQLQQVQQRLNLQNQSGSDDNANGNTNGSGDNTNGGNTNGDDNTNGGNTNGDDNANGGNTNGSDDNANGGNANDDNGGNTNGSDDNANDDNGGNDNGSDDNGGNDNGSDDNGGNDNG